MEKIELLNRFAAKGRDVRVYMLTPFTRGDWTYAADGHIAVRVQKIERVENLDDKILTEIEGLFSSSRSNDFVDMPSLPQAEKCPECNGSGAAYKCPQCDGDGEFEHGSHTYDCKECVGTGQVQDGCDEEEVCEACGGTGMVRYQPIKVGARYFGLVYLKLISELPGVKFSPGGTGGPGYFVFDGGEGVLMPMNIRE